MEFNVGEGFGRRLEMHLCAATLRLADHGKGSSRRTVCIVLLEHLALPANGKLELLGQRVDNRHPHPVQTTRHFITVVVELSAGMQHGHDDFSSRDPFLMHLSRYSTAIVRHGDGFPNMDRDFDGVTVSCQGFINRIVHQLEDHMV